MAELAPKKYLDQNGLSAFWTKVKGYINAEDGKTVTAIDTKINGLTLAYNDKTIALKRGETTISSFDASDFIKDSFLKAGELTEVDGKKTLRLTLITVERPGETGTEKTIDIDVNDLIKVTASNVTLADGTNIEKAISDLKGEDTTIKNAAAALTGRVATLEGSKDAYKAADTALETKITAAYGNADKALETKITTAYETADTAVYDAITEIPTEYINSLFAE